MIRMAVLDANLRRCNCTYDDDLAYKERMGTHLASFWTSLKVVRIAKPIALNVRRTKRITFFTAPASNLDTTCSEHSFDGDPPDSRARDISKPSRCNHPLGRPAHAVIAPILTHPPLLPCSQTPHRTTTHPRPPPALPSIYRVQGPVRWATPSPRSAARARPRCR